VNPDSPRQAILEAFHALDIRVGTVRAARIHPEARHPACQLEVDFGPLGLRASSARITDLYRPEDLPGRQVLAVVNLPPKRVGPFVSEVLVLGLVQADGSVVLVGPDRPVSPGTRLA
jgi:tRNA-binding protein